MLWIWVQIEHLACKRSCSNRHNKFTFEGFSLMLTNSEKSWQIKRRSETVVMLEIVWISGHSWYGQYFGIPLLEFIYSLYTETKIIRGLELGSFNLFNSSKLLTVSLGQLSLLPLVGQEMNSSLWRPSVVADWGCGMSVCCTMGLVC